jgi:WD40 repeat protein
MVLDQNGINLVTPGNAGLLLSLKVNPPAHFEDFSADGSTVALSTDQAHIELRSLLTWNLVRTIQTNGPFTSAVFSPDGRTLAVVITDKIATDLYAVSNGNLIKEVTGFQTAAPVLSLRFSLDSRFLIWVSRGTVQTQEIATGNLGSRLNHEDFVGDAALTPDNKILATLSAGQVNNKTVELVKLWNPANGSTTGILTESNGLGNSLSFSPDGKLLAVASGKTFVIWDVASQKKLVVLSVDTDAVGRVTFSPDGRVLATASADGWVRLWRIGP